MHKKWEKQGDGAMMLVTTTSKILAKYKKKMPPGATLNSIGSAFPELSLIAMMADSSKPAPGCVQLAFKDHIKRGFLENTETIIGRGGPESEAAKAARKAIMQSQVGLAPEPLLGGKTLGKVIDPFRPSFTGEVVINNDLKVSDVIEGIYMNLSGALRASISPEEFKRFLSHSIDQPVAKG